MSNPIADHDAVIALTQKWLEKAVIGLNLCPFAKAVHIKNQIRYVVTDAATPEELMDVLMAELEFLAEASPEKVDTTLIMHPQVLNDFEDYNDFLDVADAAHSRQCRRPAVPGPPSCSSRRHRAAAPPAGSSSTGGVPGCGRSALRPARCKVVRGRNIVHVCIAIEDANSRANMRAKPAGASACGATTGPPARRAMRKLLPEITMRTRTTLATPSVSAAAQPGPDQPSCRPRYTASAARTAPWPITVPS
eukprot:gene35814-44164_t